MEAIKLLVDSLVVIGVTYVFIRIDRARIPESYRRRGWNEASTGASVFFFGPFCLVAHFWVTRRSVRGVLLGVAVFALLMVVQACLAWLVDLVAIQITELLA